MAVMKQIQPESNLIQFLFCLANTLKLAAESFIFGNGQPCEKTQAYFSCPHELINRLNISV